MSIPGKTPRRSDLRSPVSPLPAASTSSSSSGSSAARIYDAGPSIRRSQSGEIPIGSIRDAADRPGHRRSGSGPLINSSSISSTASSAAASVLPAGNICPSGKISKMGMAPRSAARADVLGSGTGNYGHGSIIRGTSKQSGEMSAVGKAMASLDPEEVKRVGNEQYKRGLFLEAMRLYDRAILLCPESAALRSNRAAALAGMRRLGEAVKECEEAVRLDPAYRRAHKGAQGAILHFEENSALQRRHLSSFKLKESAYRPSNMKARAG